jgi:hypothetical protein
MYPAPPDQGGKGMITPAELRQFYNLVGAHCDGRIVPDQAARLQALLLRNPDLRQRYVLCTQIYAAVERSLWSVMPGADQLGSGGLQLRTAVDKSPYQSRPGGLFRNLLRRGGRAPITAATGWRAALVGAAAIVGCLAAVAIIAVRLHGHYGQSRPAATVVAAAPPADDAAPSIPPAVAQLTRLAHCRWTDSRHSRQPGDRFAAGQQLDLASGVAEVRFDRGVKVVVQGPACIEVISAIAMRLQSGKMTAEILRPEARGFQVQTSKGKVIDLGTEFGVEVTPEQDVKVHVFKGEVVVEQAAAADPPRGRPAAANSHLFRNQGLRMESGTAGPLLVEEPGETFIRTIDDVDRDRHVVAYWRFEDHPVGAVVPDTSGNTKPIRGTVDSSFNGNDLFTYSASTRPRFSDDVPADALLLSGVPNRGCLDNTVPPVEGAPTRDLYTRSRVSHASPLDIQTVKLAQWTIEASVKAKVLNAGSQTFVGRDGGNSAVMAFKINPQDHFEIYFCDVKHHSHKAVAKWRVRENRWYHVAAVSDGKTLRLYVDARTGQGYELCASCDLHPERGVAVLGPTNPNANWSVGRGRLNRLTCEWFQGWIDEVRICSVALAPSDFLFAPRGQSRLVQARAADGGGAKVASAAKECLKKKHE